MSPDENFKRELNHVFDDVSGTPSPHLRDRVRLAVSEAPEQRSTYWIAAVAAILMTALIVGILYVNNPFRQTGLLGTNPTPTPSPSNVTSPNPTPTPSPSPSPSSTPATAYICTADTLEHSLPAGSPIAYVSAMRPGSHQGYDRFVVEFSNGIPTDYVEVRPRTGTSFSETSSGQTLKLKGSNGILVSIHGADGHTSYHGSTDFVTGYNAVAEVRVIEDFEGVLNIGIGVNGPACYHAYYLSNPARLVIDVQSGS